MALVPKIEELCKECNTTVTALERDCGLSLGSVRKWDKNSPSIDRVVLVAKSLNTTVSYLIGETDIKNPASETEAGVDHTIQEWKDLLSTFSKEGLKSIIDMATAELIRRD